MEVIHSDAHGLNMYYRLQKAVGGDMSLVVIIHNNSWRILIN